MGGNCWRQADAGTGAEAADHNKAGGSFAAAAEVLRDGVQTLADVAGSVQMSSRRSNCMASERDPMTGAVRYARRDIADRCSEREVWKHP